MLRVLTSALTALLYWQIAHVLKTRMVTSMGDIFRAILVEAYVLICLISRQITMKDSLIP
jgi:hypothetical protein